MAARKETGGAHELARVRASDVMRKDVATLAADDSIESALRTFEDLGIGGAPVVDLDRRLIGVLTLSDVTREEHTSEGRILERRGTYEMPEGADERVEDVDPDEIFYLKEDYSAEALGRETVGHWMRPDPVTVRPASSLTEVSRVMVEQHVHRVFVTEDGRLVGVISSFDVVRCVAQQGRGREGERPA